jgi:bifunctional oligoribonuclease and PAP phosphatase NrnA
MSLKNAVECVKRNNSFLVTAHTNLEGDALGSELAFCRLVKLLGKEAAVVNDDLVPYGYEFMPGAGGIKRYALGMKGRKFDCFAALDCSDLKRCGNVAKLISADTEILNIDHHIDNDRFGDVNWVDGRASSCSELVYKLYKRLRVPFDKETATLLYVGIMTDTGSFRYTNTTWFTHAMVAELVRYGIDVARIYRNVNENIPLSDMKVLGSVLPSLQCDASGRIAWFKIKRTLVGHKRMSFDLSEHLLSFARSIKGVEVALLFKESLKTRNETRVNFRSQGGVDVNRIAASFGGGGHKTASGATIRGGIDAVARKVLRKVSGSLK